MFSKTMSSVPATIITIYANKTSGKTQKELSDASKIAGKICEVVPSITIKEVRQYLKNQMKFQKNENRHTRTNNWFLLCRRDVADTLLANTNFFDIAGYTVREFENRERQPKDDEEASIFVHVPLWKEDDDEMTNMTKKEHRGGIYMRLQNEINKLSSLGVFTETPIINYKKTWCNMVDSRPIRIEFPDSVSMDVRRFVMMVLHQSYVKDDSGQFICGISCNWMRKRESSK